MKIRRGDPFHEKVEKNHFFEIELIRYSSKSWELNVISFSLRASEKTKFRLIKIW
jgi:hypothetical protein